ncbi:hypothetical protein ACFWIN_27410, partial [Streptomyces sp. NPDC127049]
SRPSAPWETLSARRALVWVRGRRTPPPHPLAHISRRWLRVRDTYGVDVVREDADAALLIAVAVCVIRMAERGD